MAFCEHVLRTDAALVVPDTRLDVRFAHFASVTAEPGPGAGRQTVMARIEAMREPGQQVGQTPQSLIEQADRAMHQRKQSRARV